MKCEGCGEKYIDETGNELRKQMTIHMQQIRDQTFSMIPLCGVIFDIEYRISTRLIFDIQTLLNI